MTIFGQSISKSASIMTEIMAVSVVGFLILWYSNIYQNINTLNKFGSRQEIKIIYIEKEINLINKKLDFIIKKLEK